MGVLDESETRHHSKINTRSTSSQRSGLETRVAYSNRCPLTCLCGRGLERRKVRSGISIRSFQAERLPFYHVIPHTPRLQSTLG
jgi:hypothetical protein